MSFIRFPQNAVQRISPKLRFFSTRLVPENDEYTSTPEYPEILDLSYKACKGRNQQVEIDAIKAVKTVEEKQIKINMPRYYGFKNYMFLEDKIPYNSLPLAQYLTRTHLIESKDLPQYYEKIPTENVEKEICKDLEEVILLEYEGIKRHYDIKNADLLESERNNLITSIIVNSLNRIVNNNLIPYCAHLKHNEIDFEPKLEASWVVGGINPTERLKKQRNGHRFFRQFENDPVDRYITYQGSPLLTIRSDLPLPIILSPNEAENPSLDVPVFKLDPRVIGVATAYRYFANIPGFWPDDSHTFGIINFQKTGHILKENDVFICEKQEINENLNRQAIFSSFSWLYSQANYLGFTCYNDLTYPLVTQTVLSNGKNFKFFVYQLNTIVFYGENATENPKRNICWSTENMDLYQEISDGKIIGLNEEVVKNLIRFYSNTPEERLGINLRPYLSNEEKLISDYEDDDKRNWLQNVYKHVTSNRPKHIPIDEIYSWEKIYKIDHKMRQMEKRRRFFELFKNPLDRRLEDRLPEYVPRAHRPELPRRLGRYKKMYWP